jgi:hypothetical protein
MSIGNGSVAAWAAAGQVVDHRPYLSSGRFDLELIPPMGPGGERWYVPDGGILTTCVLYVHNALLGRLRRPSPRGYDDPVLIAAVAPKIGLRSLEFGGGDLWMWNSCFMSTLIGRYARRADWLSRAGAGRERPRRQGSFLEPRDGEALLRRRSAGAGGLLGELSRGEAPLPRQRGRMPPERPEAFRDYYHSEANSIERWGRGDLVVPVIASCPYPEYFPAIYRERLALAKRSGPMTDLIDAVLAGKPLENFNRSLISYLKGETDLRTATARIGEALMMK